MQCLIIIHQVLLCSIVPKAIQMFLMHYVVTGKLPQETNFSGLYYYVNFPYFHPFSHSKTSCVHEQNLSHHRKTDALSCLIIHTCINLAIQMEYMYS